MVKIRVHDLIFMQLTLASDRIFFLSRSAGEDVVKMWHCWAELFHRMLLLLPLLALTATAVIHTASASVQVSHFRLSFLSDPFPYTHRRCRGLLLHLITHTR